MIVVADTSPLNYLIRSGYIRILPELFGEVFVPAAVAAELMHTNAPEEVRGFAETPPDWLKRVEPRRRHEELSRSMGAGERAAISLALELDADALLIDDLPGRREAERLGVRARGTLAVLLQASVRGYVDFPEAFAAITKLGFRVSKAIERAAFKEYGKSQKA